MTLRPVLSCLAAALAIALALPAMAATVNEADAGHGDFGNNPNQAAVFGMGTDLVTGTQKTNGDKDYLTFEAFASGAEAIDFVFTNPGGTWGGFNFRLKADPFKNSNDWNQLLYSASVDGVTDSTPKTISYVLNGYTGPLHVAIDFFNADYRNGGGLVYNITTRYAAPSPAPSVPQPWIASY